MLRRRTTWIRASFGALRFTPEGQIIKRAMQTCPFLSYRLSHDGSYTPNEVKDYGYYGKNQKNVDEESCDMKDEKSA